MASVAPLSIPAGLSQITQSNFLRRAAITRATPFSVRASLSWVWEAGSNERVSMRLSRMSACGSLATPWTTLIRSYTTRRSAPIRRSRLRRPISKSITTTFCPKLAIAAPRAAVDVVLPTPPLPDVTTTTLPISPPSTAVSIKCCHHERVTFEPSLHRPAAQRFINIIGGLIETVDCQKLGFDLAAEDARVGVAARTGHGSTSKGAVNVNRTACDNLGAGRNGPDHSHVATRKNHGLSRPHWSVKQQKIGLLPARHRNRGVFCSPGVNRFEHARWTAAPE